MMDPIKQLARNNRAASKRAYERARKKRAEDARKGIEAMALRTLFPNGPQSEDDMEMIEMTVEAEYRLWLKNNGYYGK